MAVTYESIASNTVSGSSTNTITFSSISGSYTDLIVIAKVQPASDIGGQNMYMRFNGDTGTTYSSTTLSGNGTSAASSRLTGQTGIGRMDFWTAANPTATIINIQNYSNATTYKTAIIRTGQADQATKAIVGLWQSTSAITSITLYIDGGNYKDGTTFALYGIKAA